MRLGQVYSIAFGISLTILLLFAWLLNNSLNSFADRAFWEQHSQIIINKIQQLNVSMMDIETSQRGFLLTGDTILLDLLYESRDKIPNLLDTLAYLSRDNADQQKTVAALRDAIVRRLQKAQEVLNRAPYLNVAQLKIELKEGNRLMDDFRTQIHVLNDLEQVLLKERTDSKLTYQTLAPKYFKVIFFIATVVVVISFFLLIRESRQKTEAQNQLEMRVHALASVNTELQQIAYVTSHDLQEPLRKIRTFKDILMMRFADQLPNEAKTILQRIDKNANNIRGLVADLSDFASLANKNEEKSDNIDLNKILLDAQKELAAVIKEKNAQIAIVALPVIRGYEKQLYLLFKELLTNSIKFSHDHLTPEISITGNIVTNDQIGKDMKMGDRNFNVITFYDNGIGFDNELGHKIFIMFQKLHGTDSPYPGKGIGLAICRRIMSNHEGFITAQGEINKGTRIQLYFPVS